MLGGQFIAQYIAAAIPTLNADRYIHSLPAYLLRPGDSSQSCQIKDEKVRDGRSFSHRQMSAHQNGKELYRMFGYWSVEEESPDFNAHTLPDVPPLGEVTQRVTKLVPSHSQIRSTSKSLKRK